METRRLLLAFVLSLAVVAIWYTVFPPAKPKPPELPPAAAPKAVPAPGAAPAVPGAAAPGQPGQPGQPAVSQAPVPAAAPVQAAAEERITLQAGRSRAVLGNRGAQLLSMVVPEKSDPKGGTLEMVRQRAGIAYPYSLTSANGAQPSPLNQALFQAERAPDGRSATFRYSGPLGTAEKTFRFDDRGLLAVDVKVPGRSDWGVLLGPGIRNPTADEMKSRYEHRRGTYKKGDEIEMPDPGGTFDPVEVSGTALAWAGLDDTYYLAAQVPQGRIDRAIFWPMLVQPAEKGGVEQFLPVPGKDDITGDQKKLPREFFLILRPAGDQMSLASYWGSKEYDRLHALHNGLEGTIELGSLKPLVLPLLYALHWIYDRVVGNYGWAIVLLTIVIKILLLPLTHKSTMSMRKMQELNPKVQAIRDRYRSKLRDKQGKPNLEAQRKMNEDVMAVYKEAGVNPAGGCLPMLIQLPILYAFYRLLSTAVDLRHAPWLGWIQDLSAADPYLVLPIVMGITQFLQVRMGPQAGDPMQRRMFQIMPVAMTVFFLGVPSGLVLYWLTNNVLTIIQLQVYNRLREREAS
ncbi:MAG: YidC/Oxa1 family insertase periplasmic-domain containing protein [Thermoanaerobaculia bacterium]